MKNNNVKLGRKGIMEMERFHIYETVISSFRTEMASAHTQIRKCFFSSSNSDCNISGSNCDTPLIPVEFTASHR